MVLWWMFMYFGTLMSKQELYSSGSSIIVKLLLFGLAENTFIQATKQTNRTTRLFNDSSFCKKNLNVHKIRVYLSS